jgi:periplasmic copper chaperone A
VSAAWRRRAPVLVLVGVVVVVLAAWMSSGSPGGPRLRVVGAYVPEPASPDVAAAYFTVVNEGGTGDVLTGVASDVAAETMMHRSTGQVMATVGSVPVPAHGRMAFRPGGYHVMLERPGRGLRTGDHVTLTLRFRRSAAITVQAPVEPIGHTPPPDGGNR